MNKLEYKEKKRKERILAGDGYGAHLGRIVQGLPPEDARYKAKDNSHLWAMQKQIAEEIAPIVRKNQLAWVRDQQDNNK